MLSIQWPQTITQVTSVSWTSQPPPVHIRDQQHDPGLFSTVGTQTTPLHTSTGHSANGQSSAAICHAAAVRWATVNKPVVPGPEQIEGSSSASQGAVARVLHGHFQVHQSASNRTLPAGGVSTRVSPVAFTRARAPAGTHNCCYGKLPIGR